MSETITVPEDKKPLITPEMETEIEAFLPKIFDGAMTLDELTKKVFRNELLDGRHKEGRALREWLIGKGHTIKTTKYDKQGPFVLASEQIAFIEHNIETMKCMEMARIMFPTRKIGPLNKEYLAIQNKIKELKPDAVPESESVAEGAYKAPQSIYRLVPKINDSISKYKIENSKPLPLDEKLIADRDLKNLSALLGYLNNQTFVYSINIYDLTQERELFESKFIRYTYDKPDLSEEEVDQYITVCDKSVSLHQIRKNIQTLQKEINYNLETGDPEKKKVAMSFIELLNSYRAKETDAEKRLDDTLGDLVETRTERLQGRMSNNATVMNLVEAWQDKKKREEILEIAKRQRDAEEDAAKEISNMDGVVALIAGYGRNQV